MVCFDHILKVLITNSTTSKPLDPSLLRSTWATFISIPSFEDAYAERLKIGGKPYAGILHVYNPKNGLPSDVKITIKETDNSIVKEETLECADGRKKVDGPSYWELFAQFYYRDISTPEYCRVYSRPNHVFKSFGKTCLNKDGEWKVK